MLRFHSGVGASAAEKLAEEITEAGPTACSARSAKIKSPKIKIYIGAGLPLRTRVAAGRQIFAVEAILVVHLPLLGVGEHVIGFLQLLEFLFCGFVAGIQIGVIFARQLAKRCANIFRARLARHSQQFVIILFCSRRHGLRQFRREFFCRGTNYRAPAVVSSA